MLSELLPETKRLLYELEVKLNECERGGAGKGGSQSSYSLSDVDLGLQDMSVRLEALDKLAGKESKARRDDARRRVQHLRISYNHLKTSLESLQRRRNKSNGISTYQSQREELFSGVDLEEYAANIDIEMAEKKSIENSSRMVDGYLSAGRETLSELVSQRERLKSAHKKLFDILNYLGLSTNTMRSIESRDKIDAFIVFGGMALILILLFLIWWYFKR